MKYLKTFEEIDKGKNIVYTFKNKAISGTHGQYKYIIYLLQGDPKYDKTNGYSYNGLVLSINGTPASWYVSTFLHYNEDYGDYATIDGGSQWTVTNMINIRRELLDWIKNEYPKYKEEFEMKQNVNKYNL